MVRQSKRLAQKLSAGTASQTEKNVTRESFDGRRQDHISFSSSSDEEEVEEVSDHDVENDKEIYSSDEDAENQEEEEEESEWDEEEEEEKEEDIDVGDLIQVALHSFKNGLDKIQRDATQDEISSTPQELHCELLKKESEIEKEEEHADQLLKKSNLDLIETTGVLEPQRSSRGRIRDAKSVKGETAGKKWYNLPRSELDAATKRDLQLLNMRRYVHKDRFYKKSNTKKLPEFFQVGTVVGNAADYYQRLTRKERKNTLLEEFADPKFRVWTKRKYAEAQRAANNGLHKHKQKKKRDY